MESEELIPMELKMIDTWAHLAPLFGISRTTATVAVLLAMRDEPLTADEIADLLHLSRGTLSQALQEGQHVGAIRQVSTTEEHRYEMFHGDHHGMDWWAWRMGRSMQMLVGPAISVLEECIERRVLPPAIQQRCQQSLDTYQKQMYVLNTFMKLGQRRRAQMLDEMLLLAHRMEEASSVA